MKSNTIRRQVYKANRNLERETIDTMEIINRYLYEDATESTVRYALRRTAKKHRAFVKLQARIREGK